MSQPHNIYQTLDCYDDRHAVNRNDTIWLHEVDLHHYIINNDSTQTEFTVDVCNEFHVQLCSYEKHQCPFYLDAKTRNCLIQLIIALQSVATCQSGT